MFNQLTCADDPVILCQRSAFSSYWGSVLSMVQYLGHHAKKKKRKNKTPLMTRTFTGLFNMHRQTQLFLNLVCLLFCNVCILQWCLSLYVFYKKTNIDKPHGACDDGTMLLLKVPPCRRAHQMFLSVGAHLLSRAWMYKPSDSANTVASLSSVRTGFIPNYRTTGV